MVIFSSHGAAPQWSSHVWSYTESTGQHRVSGRSFRRHLSLRSPRLLPDLTTTKDGEQKRREGDSFLQTQSAVKPRYGLRNVPWSHPRCVTLIHGHHRGASVEAEPQEGGASFSGPSDAEGQSKEVYSEEPGLQESTFSRAFWVTTRTEHVFVVTRF